MFKTVRIVWIDTQAWALRRVAALSRSPRTAEHLHTGSIGEREALFHLRRLARAYLRRLPSPTREATVRSDVVSIYLEQSSPNPQARSLPGPEIELNKGAFGWA